MVEFPMAMGCVCMLSSYILADKIGVGFPYA